MIQIIFNKALGSSLMSTKAVVIDYIKQFLEENGISFNTAKKPENDSWIFRYGTLQFQVGIYLYTRLNQTKIGLVVSGVIGDTPIDKLNKRNLYEKLLALNDQMVEAAFRISENDKILLSISKDVGSVSYKELKSMINTIAKIGDSLDEELKNGF